MTKRINTVWMWQDGIHTRGVNLDEKKGILIWQDDMAAFGCVTVPAGQPITDFITNGAGRYASPPADIIQEIRESIAALGLTNTTPTPTEETPNDVL